MESSNPAISVYFSWLVLVEKDFQLTKTAPHREHVSAQVFSAVRRSIPITLIMPELNIDKSEMPIVTLKDGMSQTESEKERQGNITNR